VEYVCSGHTVVFYQSFDDCKQTNIIEITNQTMHMVNAFPQFVSQ